MKLIRVSTYINSIIVEARRRSLVVGHSLVRKRLFREPGVRPCDPAISGHQKFRFWTPSQFRIVALSLACCFHWSSSAFHEQLAL